MNRAVLSILVSNHFGVLTRVTNLFSQRGFNIDSLAVGETENENYSRITITTSGDAASVNQIKLQLDKLEDVKIVQEIPDEQLFIREVMLVKVARASIRWRHLKNVWRTLTDGRRLSRMAAVSWS